MKRIGLLLASVVLLLAGCAKEQINQTNIEEGLQTVTFTAAVEDGVTTKAAADGDGAAASVNRCIMEVYYDGNLFTRLYSAVNTQKQASFTAQLVSNRTYKVAFWADHVADAATESGLATDLYYNTASLTEVSIIDSYIGNDDARDAFAFSKEYTINQGGSSFTAILRRPFAQINVITTDVATVKKVESLVPQKVNVTLKGAYTTYNVLDSTAVAGQTSNLSYTDGLYKWDTTKSECTLSMDYIFAEKEKAVMDIDWAAIHGSDANVEHTFASVPYQRNYRTNIKGALLTTTGQWNVTVDPGWDGNRDHPVVIASTLEEAQAAAGPTSSGTAAATIIVKEEAVTNRDSGKDKTAAQVASTTPGVSLPDGSKAIEFILTEHSNEDVTFELPSLPDGNYYWYIRHEENYPTKNLNVKVSSSDATRVIIDAPDGTHVKLNDVEYTHVVALTGDNTLVVPAGITVKKLTVKKGGVEIHGTVESLEVLPESGATVKFRECENLSADVYNVAKDYIDVPLYAAKANGSKWDIVKSSCKIGEVGYASLEDAIASIPADNAEKKTIEIIKDCFIGSYINVGKKNVVFSGSSFSIKASDDNTLGSWETLVRLDGAENIEFSNVTFDGNNKNISLVGNGKNIKYSGCNFINAANAQYYGACSGTLVYENCTINTNVYAINQSESGATVTIDNCNIKGWNSFGSTETVSITDCTFGKSGYGVLRFYADAILSGCTFSDDFEFIDGGETQDAHTIIIKTCSDNVASKANLTDGPNTVFAIDAEISDQGKYKAGTYVAKKENIENNLASGYVIQDKGDNVYVVSKVDGVAKVGTVYYKTLEAAFEAVTPDIPMEWVDESVWAADKEAYFNGKAYSYLKDAIVDANKEDSAIIYIRPAYNGLTVISHDLIETDITIFGNDANVNNSWEPSLEFSGTGPEGHNLTKDITFSIYNLHNGAGAWGARTTDHVVSVVMRNCKNVHEVMIQGGSSANAICNVSVTNCTFKAGSYLAEPCLVTGNGGNIVVDGCTFEGIKTNFGININNKKGGDVETVIKNCTVRDCGTAGKEPFRFCGEVSCKQNVTIDNVAFENTTSGVNDILFGKNTTGENNCEVSYTIKNTACSYKVLTVGSTTVKTTSTTTTSDEVTGDNK